MKRKATLVYLTAGEKEALQSLATKFKTTALRGSTAGKPTFRVLLQHIAQGKIKLSAA